MILNNCGSLSMNIYKKVVNFNQDVVLNMDLNSPRPDKSIPKANPIHNFNKWLPSNKWSHCLHGLGNGIILN